jgi:hypothetical protein
MARKVPRKMIGRVLTVDNAAALLDRLGYRSDLEPPRRTSITLPA